MIAGTLQSVGITFNPNFVRTLRMEYQKVSEKNPNV